MTKITTEKTIGFIGTGVMGKSMAGHLLAGGFTLNVYNRTKSKAQELIDRGATWHDTVGSVAAASDIIITIIGYPKDVEEIYLDSNGILANSTEGKIIIDMTTSSPQLARKIYDAAKEKGVASLDAPVSGGDSGAQNATLSIMVGGDREIFDDVSPVFEMMGKNIVYQGKAGSGQHCKMANQIVIASTMMGVCEGIRYAEKAGLDLKNVLQNIEAGAAGSWSLSNLAPRIMADDFAPGFYVKHFIKDMNIALDSAKELEFSAKGLELAQSIYRQLAEDGGEDLGTQALYKMYK